MTSHQSQLLILFLLLLLSFAAEQFNFVGKLLGPKGNSLKRLQEETLTKMAILGRGSMRDKHKVRSFLFGGLVYTHGH